MKNLNLPFAQRLGLTNFLASVTGPLGKINAMGRIYDVVRFTESEMSKVKITDLGNGTSSFVPPSLSFGALDAQIEDADAQLLLQEIDAHQGWRVSDKEWVNDLKGQLSAPSAKKRK